jgi:hypothetical protein
LSDPIQNVPPGIQIMFACALSAVSELAAATLVSLISLVSRVEIGMKRLRRRKDYPVILQRTGGEFLKSHGCYSKRLARLRLAEAHRADEVKNIQCRIKSRHDFPCL